MKKAIEVICAWIKTVFGYGIMLCLLLGGLSFFGYLAALCIGGDTAAAICTFIYKKAYPVLVVVSTSMILLGLIRMYLLGESALSTKKKKNAKSAAHSEEK